MITIRTSRADDLEALVEVWASAVDATHRFLSRTDRREIEVQVRVYLATTPVTVAADADDRAVGFLHFEDGRINALFVHAGHHGRGIGRRLIDHASGFSPVLTLDVNEQNEQARAFYAHMGFEQIGRSPVDDEGRPYPLLHLRRGRRQAISNGLTP